MALEHGLNWNKVGRELSSHLGQGFQVDESAGPRTQRERYLAREQVQEGGDSWEPEGKSAQPLAGCCHDFVFT